MNSYGTYITHHAQRVHEDSVDMRTALLVSHLADIVDDIWSQPEFLDPLDNPSCVVEGVNEQYSTSVKWLHLLQYDLHCTLGNMRCNREEELASLRDLDLGPRIALHEVDEALGYGKAQTDSPIFLYNDQLRPLRETVTNMDVLSWSNHLPDRRCRWVSWYETLCNKQFVMNAFHMLN